MTGKVAAAVAAVAAVATVACGPRIGPPSGAPGGAQPATAAAPASAALPPGAGQQPPPENDRRDAQGQLIAREDDPEGEPAVIRIPGIGVDAPMVRLGLNPDRSLETPQRWHTAGWYTDAPWPGYVGPAVVAGHVDSTSGPAVFHRLHELRPGAEVYVDYDDGRRATFVVERVERHHKDAFPTRQVYGDTERPTLRLITCGGSFDPSSGHYEDNVIVYASVVEQQASG